MMYSNLAPHMERGIMPTEQTAFSRWFRRQLSEQGLSQAEFSRRSGVATSRVSDWAGGKFIPSPESAPKIARALNYDVEVVMRAIGYLEDDPYAPDPESPEEQIVAMARRVAWTEDRYNTARNILSGWIETDRAKQED